MQGHQRQLQKKKRRFPWIRTIIALLISLLIATATLLTIFNTGHIVAGYWYVVVPIIFSAFGLLIPLGQWLFPISIETKGDPPSSPPTPIEVKVSLTPPIAEPATQNAQATSSSSAQFAQREHDVIQAVDRAVQAQQGPELPTVAALLPLLQNRYSQQDVIDTLEWFHELGDIRLYKVFGGTLAWSFQLTPQGKRKLSLTG